MMRIFILSVLIFFGAGKSVQAWIPSYPDDEEFDYCIQTIRDWDRCAEDEASRTLDTVKLQYKTILANPKILEWHNDVSYDANMMRDIYESWTAFRNRYCSLGKKAEMYAEPLIDTKISCQLYHALHHKDHLDSIILWMQGKKKANQEKEGYLLIQDHDEVYENCITANPKKQCLEAEVKRQTTDIKDLYKTMLNDEYVGKWNNGDGLKSGNYRDMFDSWIAYRNRMCSLAVWAYQNAYGQQSVSLDDCIQFYNREKIETLNNLLLTAHSSLDQEYQPEEFDDGGLAEGKTIRPLKKRPDLSNLKADERLDDEEVEPETEPDTEDAEEEKAAADGKNIPAWAKQ